MDLSKKSKIFNKSSMKMSEIDDNSVQLIITSPPYWDIMDYSKNIKQIGRSQPYHKYLMELQTVWKDCERILKPSGKLCINSTILPRTDKGKRTRRHINNDIEHNILSNLTQLELYDVYIWDKGYFLFGNKHLIFGSYPYPPTFISRLDFEYINIFKKKGNPEKKSKNEKELSKLTLDEWIDFTKGVWLIPPERSRDKTHLAPFPLEIPYRLIKMFSFKNDIVLDPFAGRGTTIKVADFLDRKGIGYEINKEYVGLIQKFFSDKLNNFKLEKIVKEYLKKELNRKKIKINNIEKIDIEAMNNILEEKNKELARKLKNGFKKTSQKNLEDFLC